MKILNEEQKDYLRTLENHKKRRIFVVDCIIENLIKENEKLEEINSQVKEFLKFDMLKESVNLTNKEIIEIFEANKDIELNLITYLNILLKQQRYGLAKIFKNQIEILEIIKQMENE
jgi:hypothetical protein